MKQFLYLLILILSVSCSNNKSYKSFETLDAVVVTESKNIKTSYQKIATQKLENYLELLKLKQQYPELKEDIVKQLQHLSQKDIIDFDTNVTIANVRQIDSIEMVSDSIQKITLKYTLLSKTAKKEDSITVFIKSSPTLIDGNTIISNHITFLKE